MIVEASLKHLDSRRIWPWVSQYVCLSELIVFALASIDTNVELRFPRICVSYPLFHLSS